MSIVPRYRRESNTEGPFPHEPDRYWTLHVVSWLGMEFVLKMPRQPQSEEFFTEDKLKREFSDIFPVHTAHGNICPDCTTRMSQGGVA